MSQQWLSLTDYASKYRVSVSTLRRRIKSNQIPFRVVKGRYLVPDEGPSSDERERNVESPTFVAAPIPLRKISDEVSAEKAATAQESVFSSANQLLSELKKAYTSILQEKEEQILQLKEEVADLKTLVRVLEDENERLKKALELASRR